MPTIERMRSVALTHAIFDAARAGALPRAVEEARSELRQIKSWYAPDDADRADAAARLTPHLAALKAELIDDRNLILLFDSLDRMPPHRFENAVASDVQALQDAKIGCVIVGPMRAQYRATESIARLFDHNIHTLSDIAPDSTGLFVLAEVLRRRAPADILGDDITRRLALGSGGVMRDLIALAKSAAQEAYVDGNDFITPVHVDRAVEQLGRVRAVGLDGEQVQALRLVRDKGTLVIRGERELTLLETRRVLDYGGGKFVVHPALLPLLDVMTAAA